jgi:hypothetical protein
MDNKILVWIVIAGVLLFVVVKCTQREGYHHDNHPGYPMTKDGANATPIPPIKEQTWKSDFLPSKQGPYFQNLLPSLDVERTYHNLIKSECGGDYGNYECREKAYLKTLKGDTFDKADLLCWRHRDNEDRYYGCLDAIYGNYIWNDRFSGASPCQCPDGSQGASNAYGGCDCPPARPLHDRRMLDQNYDVVDRVVWF